MNTSKLNLDMVLEGMNGDVTKLIVRKEMWDLLTTVDAKYGEVIDGSRIITEDKFRKDLINYFEKQDLFNELDKALLLIYRDETLFNLLGVEYVNSEQELFEVVERQGLIQKI